MLSPFARAMALAALLISLAIKQTQAQTAAPNPQQKLREIQNELRESEARRRELEQEAQKLAAELKTLSARSVEAARRVQRQEQAVTTIESRITDLKRREAQLGGDLAKRRKELALTLDTLAYLGRQKGEAMIFAPRPAFDTVRASQTVAALVPEIESRARKLKSDLEALDQVRTELQAEQAALEKGLADLESDRLRLKSLQEETDAARRATLAERAEEARRATALAREARDIQALIRKLAEEEERRRAEARARAERARTDAERRALAERQTPDQFTLKEGSAALPAQGRIVTRYNERDENGAAVKGLRIATRERAQVVAPAEGRVAFAGPFKGYGLLLIIAHGGGYHSLLSGFGQLDAKVGQWVTAGEPVGRMVGGSNAQPVLYVELRQRGEPVNPLPWLASADRKIDG